MGSVTPGESGRRFMYPGQELGILRTRLFMLLCQDERYCRTIKDELRALWRAVPALPGDHPGLKDFRVLREMANDGEADPALKRYVTNVSEFVSKTLRLNYKKSPAEWAERRIHAVIAPPSRPRAIPQGLWDDFVLCGGAAAGVDQASSPDLTWDTASIPILIAVSPAGAYVQVADHEMESVSSYPHWWNYPNWDNVTQQVKERLDHELNELHSRVQKRLDDVHLRNFANLDHDQQVLLPALVQVLYHRQPRPREITRDRLKDFADRFGVDLPRR